MTAISGDRLTVRRERTLAAPPAVVYRAWLDPEGPSPAASRRDDRRLW